MFEPSYAPRVFALPVGADFSKGFLEGLLGRMQGHSPEELARVRIYVNTRRTEARLHEMLLARGARLLPDIRLITDLASDPLAPIELPLRQPALRRTLVLARLVATYLDQTDGPAPRASVFDLAGSLATLLDDFHSTGIALDRLQQIDVSDHSEHWQQTRRFLEILAGFHTQNAQKDDAERLFAAARALAENWEKSPPDQPVIVAGSTGSREATALLMRAVARLPQGAVVLPGIDRHLTSEIWSRLADDPRAADHAQSGLARFCSGLGLGPEQVSDWTLCKKLNKHRNKLISLALNPAPVTYSWLDDGPEIVPYLPDALDRVSLIEADSRKEEAAAIALCLRKAVADARQSALITPDRDLARRVASELARWGILPDDSGGEPLHLTPPGIFIRLIADMFGRKVSPKSLISLLKHPLADSVVNERVAHLNYAGKLELEALRGGSPVVSLAALSKLVENWSDPKATRWIDWIRKALEPAETALKIPLSDWVSLHRAIAETLAAGPTGDVQNELWRKDAGARLQRLFGELAAEAQAGGVLSASDYRDLLQTLLQDQSERDAVTPHPLVSIWGTLEARVQGADLVILGGLNEGTWPRLPAPDPWVNRAMRTQIGLPLPERQIGLSAHDFQQASSSAEIVWARSLRDADTPSVASRWIIRITNLLDGLGPEGQAALKRLKDRGESWLRLARSIEQPAARIAPAKRPAPRVPAAAKPPQLSVTRIASLVNDPYQIYAREILRLRPLDPLTPEMDAKLRGTVFHEIFEAFSLPGVDLTEAELLRIARDRLAEHVGPPETRELWLGRIATLAGWIVAEEVRRQEACPTSWREITGERALPEQDFKLTAKADRIGHTADGALIVYDYKTGAAPGPAEVRRYEKQLPLEAAIISGGGFQDVPPEPVAGLEYIGLADGGKITAVAVTDKDGTDLIRQTWEEFERLIATVSDDTYGFTARDRPGNLKYASDYEHLSRFGEWQDSDAPESEDMA